MGACCIHRFDVGPSDVFKKIVDSGRKIDNVQSIMETIVTYLEQLCVLKVGDIVRIEYTADTLELVKENRSKFKTKERRLP